MLFLSICIVVLFCMLVNLYYSYQDFWTNEDVRLPFKIGIAFLDAILIGALVSILIMLYGLE